MPHLADIRFKASPLNRPPRIVDAQAGRVEQTARRRKVCIYAGGHLREYAPLADDAWEVWALNLIPPLDSHRRLRCDRWFDIHQRVAQTEDDLRWIAQCPVPIYVAADLVDVGPNCVRYPDERVKEGPMACTFSYQIALALHEGFDTIGLFGVELAYGSRRERTVEWASTSWWIGYAEGRGVKVVRPSTSCLGQHPFLYGLDYTNEVEDVKAYLKRFEGADGFELDGQPQGG